MRLLHGSNVEIVYPDLKMCQSMNDFVDKEYTQYCFCSKKALKVLIKE